MPTGVCAILRGEVEGSAIPPASLIYFCLCMLATGMVLSTVAVFTGWDAALIWFHARLGAVVLVGYTLTEYVLCSRIRGRFERDEPMKDAWFLLMAAAWCRVTGYVLAHVLGRMSIPGASSMKAAGLYVSGPLAMVLMAGGLGIALAVYHRLKMLRPILMSGWIAIALVLLAAFFDAGELAYWGLVHSARNTLIPWLHWINDPLLVVLAVQAAMLAAAARELGDGLLGRCWSAYSAGIVVTAVGNFGLWLERYDFIRWPANSYPMLAWYGAVAAFAAAAAYQDLAMRVAEGSATAEPLPSSRSQG